MTDRKRSTLQFRAGEERDTLVPMRDGTVLAVDIYRPVADGRFPALLAASPYGKDFTYLPSISSFRFRETGPIEWYVERGYAYVHADVRGSGKSGGQFPNPFEGQDMYDLIEWIAVQPWCTGKVGMIGESYYGTVQWHAAAEQPPHLACIAPYDAMVDVYRETMYHGGIPAMFTSWWSFDGRARRLLDHPEPPRPGQAAADTVLVQLANPVDGPLWQALSAWTKFDRIKTPFLSIGNWEAFGLHLRGNILAFEQIQAPKKLLVTGDIGDSGSWPLVEAPDQHKRNQSQFASSEFHERELLPWYDYWLKGVENGIMGEPPVKVWVQGKGEYRVENAWPPARVRYESAYLRAVGACRGISVNDGGLSFTPPDVREGASSISYPDEEWGGWPGIGNAVLSPSGIPNRSKKSLTFTSEPLTNEIEILGPIVMKLYASSDQKDTDFFVRLADEPPVGDAEQAILDRLGQPPPTKTVSRGWLKASHRGLDLERSTPRRPWHRHTDPQPLRPGDVYEFDIEVWPAAWLFRAGHRIRIEIAPGDSPYFDGFSHYFGVKSGTDTVHHDARYPSHVLLPVLT